MIANRDDEEIENRRLRAENARLQRELDIAKRGNQRQWDENARLRAALEQVQWIGQIERHYDHGQCPWCQAFENHGHADNCARQLAINPAAAGEGVKG